eukprot:Awhi_evm1s3940
MIQTLDLKCNVDYYDEEQSDFKLLAFSNFRHDELHKPVNDDDMFNFEMADVLNLRVDLTPPHSPPPSTFETDIKKEDEHLDCVNVHPIDFDFLLEPQVDVSANNLMFMDTETTMKNEFLGTLTAPSSPLNFSSTEVNSGFDLGMEGLEQDHNMIYQNNGLINDFYMNNTFSDDIEIESFDNYNPVGMFKSDSNNSMIHVDVETEIDVENVENEDFVDVVGMDDDNNILLTGQTPAIKIKKEFEHGIDLFSPQGYFPHSHTPVTSQAFKKEVKTEPIISCDLLNNNINTNNNNNNYYTPNPTSSANKPAQSNSSTTKSTHQKKIGKTPKSKYIKKSVLQKYLQKEELLELTEEELMLLDKNGPLYKRARSRMRRNMPYNKEELEAKRKTHNVLEKRRREDMRGVLDELKGVLLNGIVSTTTPITPTKMNLNQQPQQQQQKKENTPLGVRAAFIQQSLSGAARSLKPNSSQAQVLQCATEYIQKQKECAQHLEQLRADAKSKNIDLMKRLKELSAQANDDSISIM